MNKSEEIQMAGVDGRLIVLTLMLRLSYSAVQTEQVIA